MSLALPVNADRPLPPLLPPKYPYFTRSSHRSDSRGVTIFSYLRGGAARN
ncbi:hypothetical protein QUB68_13320 [Microcoleus sp. A006_D1]